MNIKNAIFSLTVAGIGFVQTVNAVPISVPMADPNGNFAATGTTFVTENANGPDQLLLTASGLEANRKFTVFLAASPVIGALPVQFLGEMTADAAGDAAFAVTTEILDAYAAVNPSMTNADGVAPAVAGALGNGAFAIPLDWVRVYQAEADPGFGGSVFGANADITSPGGIHVLSTNASFNDEAPLTANAGADITAQAPQQEGDNRFIALSGDASTGNIASYTWTVISKPDSGITFSSVALHEDPAELSLDQQLTLSTPDVFLQVFSRAADSFVTGLEFNDLAGEQVVLELTVTDSLGNESSDEITITLTN